jgi:hypothetical protein
MEFFYTIVLLIAVILLILVLTYIGIKISGQKQGSSVDFPPRQNTCPDNWKAKTITDSNNNESVYCEVPTENMKNVGTLLETSTNDSTKTNAQMSSGFNDTLFSDATNGVIDFNSPTWLAQGSSAECSKQLWANTYDIQWDGITNMSGCS